MSAAGSPPPIWRILTAFAAIYFLWGSTYLFIRFTLETLPPFLISGSRFVVAGAVLMLLARRLGAAWPQPIHWRSAAVLGALMFVVANGGIMIAEQVVPSGLTALLIATVPMWIVMLGWLVFGGARPGGRSAAGLVLGLVGIGLLVNPGALDGRSLHLGGALILVLSSSGWASGTLLSRRLATPASPLLGAGMNLLVGGLMLLALSALTGEWAALRLEAVSWKSVLSVLYLSLFGSVLGYSSYMWLLGVVAADRVATYAYVNPVVAVFLGWAVGGEALTPLTLLAAAVIVTAVALITTDRPRPLPAAEPVRVAPVSPQPQLDRPG